LRAEQRTLQKYEEMFDSMTAEENGEFREWLANGNSANNNLEYFPNCFREAAGRLRLKMCPLHGRVGCRCGEYEGCVC